MKSSTTYQFLLRHATLVILLASAILFFANNWNLPIYILDEAKNAECAREMWEKGDYTVPTFNYEMRTDKPPLHYFFMALAYSVFGANAFAAHFFAAIMGILTVWVSFFYTRQFLGKSTAFLTALVLLSSIHFLFQFHLAVPDPFLIFSITVSIFSFYFYFNKKYISQLWIGYTFAALGVLAKGPVALGLIGLTMLLYLIFSRQLNWKTLKSLRISLGGLLFLSVALPWYIAVGNATEGEWVQDFFFKHNFNRFGDTMEGHGGGFWVTFLYVFLGLFPFAVFLPQSLALAWRSREQSFLKLCLIATGVIIGFFALSSTKLPNYTVPAYPFLAVLIAYFLDHILEKKDWENSKLAWSVGGGLLLSITLGIAAYFGLQSYPLLSDLAILGFVFVPCILGFLITFFVKQHWVTSMAIGTVLTSLLLFYVVLPSIMSRNPVQESSYLLENKKVIAYKRFNPAYCFHVQEPIPVLEEVSDVSDCLKKSPKTLVLSFTKYASDLEELGLDTLFIQQDLFEGTKTIILK